MNNSETNASQIDYDSDVIDSIIGLNLDSISNLSSSTYADEFMITDFLGNLFKEINGSSNSVTGMWDELKNGLREYVDSLEDIPVPPDVTDETPEEIPASTEVIDETPEEIPVSTDVTEEELDNELILDKPSGIKIELKDEKNSTSEGMVSVKSEKLRNNRSASQATNRNNQTSQSPLDGQQNEINDLSKDVIINYVKNKYVGNESTMYDSIKKCSDYIVKNNLSLESFVDGYYSNSLSLDDETRVFLSNLISSINSGFNIDLNDSSKKEYFVEILKKICW